MRGLITVSALILLTLLACHSGNVKNETANETIVSDIRYDGLEQGVTTRWVDRLPEDKNLAVYKGSIAAVGNEPFVGYALDLGDSKMIRLSGDKKFIDFLKNNQLDYLEVAGELFQKDNYQYLRVLYVITPMKGQ